MTRAELRQEIDAIVGRLVRERAELVRQQAAIEAELRRLEEVLTDVLRRRHALPRAQLQAKLESVGKYFSTEAFLGMLDEKERIGAAIVERVKQLRAFENP